MYVEPAGSRHLDPESGYRETDLNLTYALESCDGQNLTFDTKFHNPLEVSPLQKQDELVMHFLGNASDYIYSPKLNKTLSEESKTLRIKLKK